MRRRPEHADRRGVTNEERARLAGCLLAGAILVAPFLALLYDLAVGLAVMALALGATAAVAVQAGRMAEPPLRRRLLAAATINGALALLVVVVLVARLTS